MVAEFTDVVKQARRLCEAQEECEECPIFQECNGSGCIGWDDENETKALEQKVMDWAAEHPEPRLPTWEEWQDATFPDALCDVCPRVFGVAPMDGCMNVSCDDCMSAHIPANIAEKLGIKPIGGDA